MNTIGKVGIAAVAVAVIVVGVVMLTNNSNNSAQEPGTTPTTDTSSSTDTTQTPASEAKTITYNGTAFEPQALTVKAGTTITVTNQSEDALSFNSDPHPTHTIQPELNVGNIEPGQSKTFTITKTGTWGYHNHRNASHKGTIVVE